MSHRKPLTALAAVTAALALAVPAASANAATTPTVDPTVCQILNNEMRPFGPTMFLGGDSLRSTLANAGSSVGCPAPPPQPSWLPVLPGR
jgi:hypothetical protein